MLVLPDNILKSCLSLVLASTIWFHKISYDKVEEVLNSVEYSVECYLESVEIIV